MEDAMWKVIIKCDKTFTIKTSLDGQKWDTVKSMDRNIGSNESLYCSAQL